MKITFLVFALYFIFLIPNAIGQTDVIYTNRSERTIDFGIGLGSTIAVVISWSRNQSVLFAIIHGLLGWLYIIYYLFTKKEKSNR